MEWHLDKGRFGCRRHHLEYVSASKAGTPLLKALSSQRTAQRFAQVEAGRSIVSTSLSAIRVSRIGKAFIAEKGWTMKSIAFVVSVYILMALVQAKAGSIVWSELLVLDSLNNRTAISHH